MHSDHVDTLLGIVKLVRARMKLFVENSSDLLKGGIAIEKGESIKFVVKVLVEQYLVPK